MNGVVGRLRVDADLMELVRRAHVAPQRPIDGRAWHRGWSDQVRDRDRERTERTGDRLERGSQRQPLVARDPELVGVGVDDPVGRVLGPRPSGHRRDHGMLLLAEDGIVGQVDDAEIGVALEHLRRPVDRTVVGGDDQVGPLGQVMLDHRGDDVDLVADHHGDHEPHAGDSPGSKTGMSLTVCSASDRTTSASRVRPVPGPSSVRFTKNSWPIVSAKAASRTEIRPSA